MALNTGGYRSAWNAIKEAPEAIGNFFKNSGSIVAGSARTTGAFGGGIVGGALWVVNTIANGAAGIFGAIGKAANFVMNSRVLASVTLLVVSVGAYLGINKSMKARDQRIEAEKQQLSAAIVAQDQANQQMAYHPADMAGDKWANLANERAATSATQRLEQQPATSPALGA